jgi:hypothetical protein
MLGLHLLRCARAHVFTLPLYCFSLDFSTSEASSKKNCPKGAQKEFSIAFFGGRGAAGSAVFFSTTASTTASSSAVMACVHFLVGLFFSSSPFPPYVCVCVCASVRASVCLVSGMTCFSRQAGRKVSGCVECYGDTSASTCAPIDITRR